MRRTSLAVLLALTAAAAGCSSTEAATPPPAVPLEKPSPSPSPTPTPSGPAAVGTAQDSVADDSRATITPMRLKYLHPQHGLAQAGRDYLGVDVKYCLRENTGETVGVSSRPWTVSFADDTMAEAMVSSGMFSVPLYPEDREVRSGSCVRGWIVFDVPENSKPRRLAYQPGSGNSLEWAVK